MPTIAISRETHVRRSLLAFQQALSRGWDRDKIIEELGISRTTYYRWMAKLESVRCPKASEN